MHGNSRTLIKWTIGGLITLLVMGYTYIATKDFIAGPTITVISPADGATVSHSLVEIVGTAKNISSITLDDREIFIDDKGNFKEKLLLYPGYNIISVKANDRYQRTTEKTIQLILREDVSAGTSTVSTP